MENLKTIRDLVRYCASNMLQADVFFGHGTDNAFDEAYALTLHALHLPFDLNASYLNSAVTADEKQYILTLLTQRVEQRLPLPYLMGCAHFAGLEFKVNTDVLIPRSPIAELIEAQFEPWVNADRVHRILDVCTGCGCIGIACAYAFPDARVDLTDISEKALMVARMNINTHDCNDHIRALQSDLFDALGDESYDLIVSNPPYVSADEMALLPAEYRHEPKQALLAEDRGLAVVRKILTQARRYLSPHGVLVVEVGATAEVLAQAYPDAPFMWLDFEFGGEGVLLLTAEQLENYAFDA